MKKIFCHKVSIYKKPVNHRWYKDSFKIEQISVFAENDRYIVLENDYFTKLEKKCDGICNSVLNKESIRIATGNHILGDGVFYTLYSTSKRRPSTIKRHIEKKIESEYGWLSNAVDLSIIK